MWRGLSRKLIPSAGIQRCILIAVRPCRMRVLALCFQIDILMLNLGQLHLKFFFFFFMLSHLFNYWAQLYNGLTLFDVQQLVVDSARRTVFENQTKENAGGKRIKHQLFPVDNKRTAVYAVSPVIEYAAATRRAWVCVAQSAGAIWESGVLWSNGNIIHRSRSPGYGAAIWEPQYLSFRIYIIACVDSIL